MKRVLVLVGLGLLPAGARGDGLAQIMTTKSIPASTIAVIDPETGSSSGSAGGDVRISPGDIIQFRFRYLPLPDNNGSLVALQGYLTEYIPNNTTVVGMRILDRDTDTATTIKPRWPGLSVESGSGTSMSQLIGDTGVFVTSDSRLVRTPRDQFLRVNNGLTVAPAQGTNIDEVVGANAGFFAHNMWDDQQDAAFHNGDLPATQKGSPVAGSGTFYTGDASGTGPWSRTIYPGALIGRNVPGGEILSRAVDYASVTAGPDLLDLTPLSSAGVGATAVRIALGDLRLGKEGVAEVSLKVIDTPLEFGAGSMNESVDCAEVFGSDNAKRNDMVNGPGAQQTPWAYLLPSPACVFLKLFFDLKASNPLALNGETVTFTLKGKNLSENAQTGVKVYFGYAGSGLGTITPAGSTQVACPAALSGLGLTCRMWDIGTLQRSQEYTHTIAWTVSGPGPVTDVIRAAYYSDDIDGFPTQAVVFKQPIPVMNASFSLPSPKDTISVNPGADILVTGSISNSGTGGLTISKERVFAPEGWSVVAMNNGNDGTIECAGPFTTEGVCGSSITLAAGASRSYSFKIRPAAGAAVGIYPVHFDFFAKAASFGGEFENFFPEVVMVPVTQNRTAAPLLDCPVRVGQNSITGEAVAGATVRVYFNGILRCQTTANGSGDWSCSGYTGTFGTLHGGLEVRATAELAPLQESVYSNKCDVVQIRQCSDRDDNDDDGLTDYPNDPGCSSVFDDDETNSGVQCSDGLDNDNANGTDYPNDKGCYGPDDPLEAPECSDGFDNDGDGQTDAPDADCDNPDDNVEGPSGECGDGIDNDDDGKEDYPDDPGCHSRNDDSEDDPAFTPVDVKPRLLFIVDTSGSMNLHTCAVEPVGNDMTTWTQGDGSAECAGVDVSCNTCSSFGCGNGLKDDSRLYKVKSGLRDVLGAFGEVEFGLMRFIQRPVQDFACPQFQAVLPSGGWQGSGLSPCSGANGAETLVRFALDDNRYDMLQWLDNNDNFGGGEAPPRLDIELRGTGTTPLAGSLSSAREYLQDVKEDDEDATCRPYRIILLTDGLESCGGNPATIAGQIFTQDGVKVNVIGFAATNPDIGTQLNSIASQGGTGSAILVDTPAALAAAIAKIISETVKVEYCNNLDDNCNELIDETFPNKGDDCFIGVGQCAGAGHYICDGLNGTKCDAVEGQPGEEVCNQLDDNCNGQVDEGLTCQDCVPEVCNGFDDDCNGTADDGVLPGVGDQCGIDTGLCEFGTLQCFGVQGLLCTGGTGPDLEVCDGEDNDCDGQTDGQIDVCYPANADGCEPSPTGQGYLCQGVCNPGLQECVNGVPGTCDGAVTPTFEKCNGLDDDCDGIVDNGFNSGAECSIGIGGCHTTGILICTGDGTGTFCTAPIVTGTEEICDGIDNDCDTMVDEEPLGSPIGDDCGGQGDCQLGQFQCVEGTIVCVGSGSGTPEICDAKDNDCDGFIDEAPLPGTGADCPPDGYTLPLKGTCKAGMLQCVLDGMGGASVKCVGAVGGSAELCNGKDDDCDGMADDMATCPSPTDACFEGTCVRPCGEGEFPCGFGFRCKDLPDLGRYCVPNPCDFIACGTGTTCNPDTAECEDLCKNVTCTLPRTCVTGRCVDCFVTGCQPPLICRANATGVGSCQTDPCATVDCGAGKFCREGLCIALGCDPECAEGSECIDGECKVLSCDPENCRNRSCGAGQACDPTDGRCVPDPCLGVNCPEGLNCRVTCNAKATCEVPANPDVETVKVLATGSGGFSCSVAVGDSDPKGWIVLMLMAGAIVVVRRRRK